MILRFRLFNNTSCRFVNVLLRILWRTLYSSAWKSSNFHQRVFTNSRKSVGRSFPSLAFHLPCFFQHQSHLNAPESSYRLPFPGQKRYGIIFIRLNILSSRWKTSSQILSSRQSPSRLKPLSSFYLSLFLSFQRDWVQSLAPRPSATARWLSGKFTVFKSLHIVEKSTPLQSFYIIFDWQLWNIPDGAWTRKLWSGKK